MRRVKAVTLWGAPLKALAGKREWRGRALGTLMFIVAVLTLGWIWLIQHQASERATCLARANQRVTQVLQLRGTYADQDHNATVRLILTVSTATSDTVVRAAFAEYAQQEAQISKERQGHPIPVINIEACA